MFSDRTYEDGDFERLGLDCECHIVHSQWNAVDDSIGETIFTQRSIQEQHIE